MKTFYDCIPCFIKQTLNVTRMSMPENDEVLEKVLKNVLNQILTIDMTTPPPVVASRIHRIIKASTDNRDPYQGVKEKYNREAMDLYPYLKTLVQEAEDSFFMAVKVAIAGNIIDFGARSTQEDLHLKESIDEVLDQPLAINHVEYLRAEIKRAQSILYLADNTGEIIFDRVFIEQIMPVNITLAVRGKPIINDANYEDAEFAGLTNLVKVIDNGADVPGTYLPDCSESFRACFESADLIISKGQGNYETLSDTNKNIVFLLRAKCDCVSKEIGCNLNDILVISKQL